MSTIYQTRGQVKVVVLEIGTWDMNATASKTVSHGLEEQSIRGAHVAIRSDSLTLITPIEAVSGVTTGSWSLNAFTAAITVERVTGGYYDAITYQSTSINRGWVTLLYE